VKPTKVFTAGGEKADDFHAVDHVFRGFLVSGRSDAKPGMYLPVSALETGKAGCRSKKHIFVDLSDEI
jgi:hypothetical protein